MANQWFKFYGQDFLNDLKFKNLSASFRSCWITLLCYGSLNNGVIKYLTEDQLKIDAGMPFGSPEFINTQNVFATFQALEMINIENGVITIIHWEKRQEKPLTAYERVKKFREKKRMITTDNESDNDRIEENRIDKNRIEEKEWIDKKVWEQWVTYRKEIKKALKPSTVKLQLAFLEKNKTDHASIILQSIQNGWTGLFALKGNFKATSPPVYKNQNDNDIINKLKAKTITSQT